MIKFKKNYKNLIKKINNNNNHHNNYNTQKNPSNHQQIIEDIQVHFMKFIHHQIKFY